MSKGNQQALVMLSCLAGCAGNLIATNAYARVDIKKLINDIFDETCRVINWWPADATESVEAATVKIKAWAGEMGG